MNNQYNNMSVCECGMTKPLVPNSKNCYKLTCGARACVNARRKRTMMANHGAEHALQSSGIKKKMKEKLVSRYGVDNVSKMSSVKEKKKRTCFASFGVEHPMQSTVVMSKSKKTLLTLYGVDNISKLTETIQQIQKTKNTPDPFTLS